VAFHDFLKLSLVEDETAQAAGLPFDYLLGILIMKLKTAENRLRAPQVHEALSGSSIFSWYWYILKL